MGFELGIHGYDHVRWQDRLDDLGQSGLAAQIDQALESYRAILGIPARSFAAPGWRTNLNALKILDARGLSYHSDTRGHTPYRSAIDGIIFETPEIPTTLPTMDEVMGTRGLNSSDELVRFYLEQFSECRLNVHTIHAETEGMGQLDMFGAIVRGLIQRGAQFVQLGDVAQRLSRTELPVCEVKRITLPGRAGWISAQGEEGRENKEVRNER
jgi:peptidoglycan/xylan/chitin deacetylase (PgdA/CDA1 family)